MKLSIKELFNIQVPSDQIDDIFLIFPGGKMELRYNFFKDSIIYKTGFLFNRIQAFKFEADLYPEGWKIDHSYDTLIQVVNSPWIEEMEEGQSEDIIKRRTLNHYLIYFHHFGCYEVVAATWDTLPVEEGTWE